MIERLAGIPVLVAIPPYPTPSDRRRKTAQLIIAFVLIVGVAVTYAITYLLRMEAMR